MTYLSKLRAELAETNIDVLAPEAAFMVKGGTSYGGSKGGSKKKNSGGKKKSNKGGYGGYGGYGGGNGCNCGCGH
jgi:hypothetical protein